MEQTFDNPPAAPFGTPKGEAWENLSHLFNSLSAGSGAKLASACSISNQNGVITHSGNVIYNQISCANFLNTPGAIGFWVTNIAPSLQPVVDWYFSNATNAIPNGGIPRAYSVICPCTDSPVMDTCFDGCQLQTSLKNAQQCAARSLNSRGGVYVAPTKPGAFHPSP